jgi:hypothetical protein
LQQLRTSNVILNFGNIVVNNINHTSGMFFGENYQFGWSAHFKAIHGFGETLGYLSTASVNVVAIYDNDYIDAPINENAIMIGNAADTGVPISPLTPTVPV